MKQKTFLSATFMLALVFALPGSAFAAGHNGATMRAFYVVPLLVIAAASIAATVTILAALCQRVNRLMSWLDRCGRGLENRIWISTVWGVLAQAGGLVIGGFLVHVHLLAGIGVLCLLVTIVYTALGAAIAWERLGNALLWASGTKPSSRAKMIGTGFATSLFSGAMPIFGWFAVYVPVAAGLGAILVDLVAPLDKPKPEADDPAI